MEKNPHNITKIQTTTKILIKTKLLIALIMIVSIGIIFAIISSTLDEMDTKEVEVDNTNTTPNEENQKIEEIKNDNTNKEYPNLALGEITLEEYPKSQIETVNLVAKITSDQTNQELLKENSIFKLDGSKSTVSFNNGTSSDIYHKTYYKWNYCEHIALIRQDGAMAEFKVNEVNNDTECLISLRIEYGKNISDPDKIILKIKNTQEIQQDNTAPEITLNGDNPFHINVGESYTEPGATAIDNIDGSITVRISGNVNTNTEGTYTITYTSTDNARNTTTTTRTIIVIPKPNSNGGNIIVPGINNEDEDKKQDTEIIDDATEEIDWTNGRWIKIPNKSTVYFLDNKNTRHVYPHESIWLSYFDKSFFSNVETISDQELIQYPLGKNVTFKPQTLIKIPSTPNVYKVIDSSGKIKWVKSETTAEKLFGNNWNNYVKDLNEVFFGDYINDGEIQ